MRILITGGKGQLGMDVTNILRTCGYEVFSYSSTELDITNPKNVVKVFAESRPNIVIHTAAYTKVDLAEEERERVYAVNAFGTRNVAVEAEKYQAKLIYISTDYVFNGVSLIPYNEFDAVNPINIYGKSKLAGEEFVQQLSSRFFILRTSWVYGKHGNNFVKTMLNLAKKMPSLNVVNDQVGSPTYTVDIVNFIFEIMVTDLYGIYHVSNTGSCTWYQFAKEIFKLAHINNVQVNPVTTNEFPRPASRPANSVLDHMAIRLNRLSDLPPWQESLGIFLKALEVGD